MLSVKIALHSNQDDKSRLYRRTLMRYACLSICDTLRMVSSKVMKRFPTYEHMVDAGLMTTKEVSECVWRVADRPRR